MLKLEKWRSPRRQWEAYLEVEEADWSAEEADTMRVVSIEVLGFHKTKAEAIEAARQETHWESCDCGRSREEGCNGPRVLGIMVRKVEHSYGREYKVAVQ